MNKVTVVIPNYNGIKYIENCLYSLFHQTSQEMSVMVVDNGSTDGSCELVREKFPKAELICLKENTGFCHAVNLGIRKAKTPYVILLNNDTEILSGFVEALTEAIEAESKLFSVSACVLMWDNPRLIDSAGDRYTALGWAYSRGNQKAADKFKAPAEIFSASGAGAIYRKEIFDKIGYFDEHHFAYLEDVDIGYRARIHGYRSRYEPGARVRHAGSATSGSRHNPFKVGLSSANNVYLIWKNMPFIQWLWNLPLLLAGFIIKTVYFMMKKMGMIYLKGLWRGFLRCFRQPYRENKVKFRVKNIGNYLLIQLQMYINIFRMPGKR